MATISNVKQAVTPLVRKVKKFSCPGTNYTRTATDFFEGSAKRPYMKEVKYTYNGNVTGLYAERQLQNGGRFIKYELDGRIIKAIRDRCGKITDIKANFSMARDPEEIMGIAQDIMVMRNNALTSIAPPISKF